jgi:hypothetical protein
MQLLTRIAALCGFVVLGSMLTLIGYITVKKKDPLEWFLFSLLLIGVTLLTAVFIRVWKAGA